MSRRGSDFYTRALFAALLVCSVVLSVLILREIVGTKATREDARLPHLLQTPSTLREVLREAVGRPWDNLMLVFDDSASGSPRLKYLEALRERLQGKSLDFLLVCAPDSAWDCAGPEGDIGGQSHWPRYADRSLALHAHFRIVPEHGHGGVVVLDHDGALVFRALALPSPDELRQLGEKYALGAIEYEPAAEAVTVSFEVGKVLPAWSARNVETDEVVQVRSLADRTLVVFGAACASCQLAEAAGRVKAALIGDPGPAKPAVLFAPNFDAGLLKSMVRAGWFPPESYVVESSALPSALYETRARDLRPVIARTDAAGRVVGVSRLGDP